MKKISVILIAFTALAVDIRAQGEFAFRAGPSSGLVRYSTDGTTTPAYPVSGLANWGTAHVGFFAAPNGTVLGLGLNGLPDFSAWTALSTTANLSPAAGNVLPTSIFDSTAAPDANTEVEVVAWTGTATSWAQAVGGAGGLAFSGQIFNGTQYGALGWSQPTINPFDNAPPPAAALVTGTGGYAGLVLIPLFSPTPEPSAFALVLLGAGMAGVWRFAARRKA